MKIEKTNLKGCFVLTPRIFKDSRGEFFESYSKQVLSEEIGIDQEFVQDNQSISKKGVLRGLHFQEGTHSQAKLVSVTRGSVLDICVDIRKDSSTFGEYFSIVLSSEDKKQVYIPRGFAHGFLALSDNTIFNYKCDNYYDRVSERGIIYSDPTLAIDWGFDAKNLILSNKDEQLPTLQGYLDEKKD